ncbi:MAG: M67 family metallopeptidase [Chloroflexi bacterium]|nr:M67 family metallopeptidase [Chloroflexota bacterium]
MTLIISSDTFASITAHLQAAYPNEGVGLLLGRADGAQKTAQAALLLPNRFEADEQHHRYLVTAQDMLDGETQAEQRGLDVIGIVHSHPDHPAQASEFDREFALPWYSYLIVSVPKGLPDAARAWVLADDRSRFVEEEFVIE